MGIEAPVSPVWAIENRIIKTDSRDTPARVYLPNQKEDLPVILLIHGGAWIAGNLDTHDNWARYLCSQVEAVVVSVGYMNAPEGKFPFQLQQSLDALAWIINHANEFSANTSKLAIVGDSQALQCNKQGDSLLCDIFTNLSKRTSAAEIRNCSASKRIRKRGEMIYLFITIQCILFFFMALHDWVDIPPLTNLAALKRAHTLKFRLIGSFINATLVLIPITVTFFYFGSPLPFWARLFFVSIYSLITFGTITAWWVPYFGGGYLIHGNRAGFEEYRDTHSFLPPRGDNVVPNTLHVILHIQIWLCFGLSLYWLCNGGWKL